MSNNEESNDNLIKARLLENENVIEFTELQTKNFEIEEDLVGEEINLNIKKDDFYQVPWRAEVSELYESNEKTKLIKIAERYGKIFTDNPITEIEDAKTVEIDDKIKFYNFSPDDEKIFALGAETIYLIDSNTRNVITSKSVDKNFYYYPFLSWNKDGSMVAISMHEKIVEVIDINSNDLETVCSIDLLEKVKNKVVVRWYPSKYIAMSYSKLIEIVELTEEKEYKKICTINLDHKVFDIKFNQNGDNIYALINKNIFRTYDFEGNVIDEIVLDDLASIHGKCLNFTITSDAKNIWFGFNSGFLHQIEIATFIDVRSISAIISWPQYLDVSEHDNLISYHDGSPVISIRDTKEGNFLFRIEGKNAIWSKNNRYLGYLQDNKIKLLNIFNIVKKQAQPVESFYRFTLCPNQKYIAITFKKNWNMKLFGLNDLENPLHEFVHYPEGRYYFIVTIAFNADSTKICYPENENIYIWDIEKNEFTKIYTLTKGNIGDDDMTTSFEITWSNQNIYIGDEDGKIIIIDEKSYETKMVLQKHKNTVEYICLNSDETKMISNEERSCEFLFWIFEGESFRYITAYGHQDFVHVVNFSVCEKKIISGDGSCTIIIWDAENLQILNKLVLSDFFRNIVWGPGGTNIAVIYRKKIEILNSQLAMTKSVKDKLVLQKNFSWLKDGKSFYIQTIDKEKQFYLTQYEIITSNFNDYLLQKQAFHFLKKKKIGQLEAIYNYFPCGDNLLHCAVYADVWNGNTHMTKRYLEAVSGYPENFRLVINKEGYSPLDLAFEFKRQELVYLILDFCIKHQEKIPVFHNITYSIKQYFDKIVQLNEPLNLKDFLDSQLKLISYKATPQVANYFEDNIFHTFDNKMDVYFPQIYDELLSKAEKKTFDGIESSITESKHFKRLESTLLKTDDKQTDFSKVYFYVFDFPGILAPDKENKFMETVANLDSDNDIFTSKFLELVLTYKWRTYAKKLYMLDALFYFVFVAIFCVYFTIFKPKQHFEKNFGIYHVLSVIFELIILIYLGYFVSKELRQIEKVDIESYKNIWNANDLINYLLLTPIVIIDCLSIFGVYENPRALQILTSFCVFFLILRMTSYLRVFKGTAFLIRMITQNFIIVLLIFIIAFSFSIFLLQNYQQSTDFLSVLTSLYNFAIGEYDDFNNIPTIEAKVFLYNI